MAYQKSTDSISKDLGQLDCSDLLKEVKEMVQKLKEYGMSEKELTSLFHTEQPILKLFVSKNYKIFLGDERKEVHMEPLVKAVFLLFLKHPEGILFKHLPDYREELMQIYVKLRPNGLNDRAIQSIEDVTNPLLNSINEKCARVRKVFITLLNSKAAEYYYIKGTRGGIKSISLPRDYLFWE